MIVSEQMFGFGSNSSVIRELFEYGKKQEAIVGKENVFDFSIGNPTVPAPECVKNAILELLETPNTAEIHGYTSAQGDLEVRTGLADYMNKKYACNLSAQNFYMTCGAAASLTITLKALTQTPDDEFIIIAPYFPEYQVFIKNAGAKIVVIEPDTGHFQIDMGALEEAITPNTKGVIINSPNNPSGVVYSRETLEELAQVLKEKSQAYKKPIYILADEPYREIVYDGVEVPYLPHIYSNTVICYSFSKSLSLPGERIGYILVPDEVENGKEIYTAACGAGRAQGYVCAPSLFQKVILKCLGETGDISLYDTNRKMLYETLTEMGYECVRPDGAFYLFVKAMEEDANKFSENAKQFNLLIVPADDFGCPGYVRISYCVSPEMIERSFAAFSKLKDLYK